MRAVPAAARGSLDEALHAASLSGLHGAFLVAGISGVLAGLVVLVMVRPAAPAGAPPGAPAEAAYRMITDDHQKLLAERGFW